jgi:hypothetical protein
VRLNRFVADSERFFCAKPPIATSVEQISIKIGIICFECAKAVRNSLVLYHKSVSRPLRRGRVIPVTAEPWADTATSTRQLMIAVRVGGHGTRPDSHRPV